MKINVTAENNKAIVAPVGRLDTLTAPMLEQDMEPILEKATELILDLAELEYISSAGLRVLLKLQKRMNNCGTMELRNVNETVMEVLEITGFADILTIR